MGNLTDDMTRLRGEVEVLRGARGAMMQDLAHGARELTMAVAAMRTDFISSHAAMAKQTRGEREAFVTAVTSEVNSLLGAFSRERDDMARKGRHDRRVFLLEMRRQVKGMCKETTDDLMGARLAWSARNPEKSQLISKKKEPAVVKKPMSPPVEASQKETAAAPETKAEMPPVTLMEPVRDLLFKGDEKKKRPSRRPKPRRPPRTKLKP